MSFSDFSSWPREQEQAFVVYEARIAESQNKAWMIGAIFAGLFLVFALGVYFGITPKHVEHTDETSSQTKKADRAEAPAAEKK